MIPNCTTDPRMAGQVERFHTWPVLRRQTVAEHAWNAARILLSIFPEAPRELIVQTLLHDVGEIATGDVPSYTKSGSSVIKREMDKLEERAWLAMCLPWGLPAPVPVHENSVLITKLADVMELWETGLQELAMGNQLAMLIKVKIGEDMYARIDAMQRSENPLLISVGERALTYVARRVREWSV